MVGNHRAFPDIQLFVAVEYGISAPFIKEHLCRIRSIIPRHVLCGAFSVLVGILAVKLGVAHVPQTSGDDFPCVLDVLAEFCRNTGYRFIVGFAVFVVERHCTAEQLVFVIALNGIARPHRTDIVVDLVFDIIFLVNEKRNAERNIVVGERFQNSVHGGLLHIHKMPPHRILLYGGHHLRI